MLNFYLQDSLRKLYLYIKQTEQENMGKLAGLKNKSADVDALFISRASEISILMKNPAYGLTAAGRNGSINVWIDDDDNLRVQAMQWCQTVDERVCKNLSEARQWTRMWLKKIK